MTFVFATCDPIRALGFIQRLYPSLTITKEDIPLILDLVSRDILRIPDPMMHGSRVTIQGGNNYSPKYDEEIKLAQTQLLKFVGQYTDPDPMATVTPTRSKYPDEITKEEWEAGIKSPLRHSELKKLIGQRLTVYYYERRGKKFQYPVTKNRHVHIYRKNTAVVDYAENEGYGVYWIRFKIGDSEYSESKRFFNGHAEQKFRNYLDQYYFKLLNS